MGQLFPEETDAPTIETDEGAVRRMSGSLHPADPQVRNVAVCDNGGKGWMNYKMTIPLDFARELDIDENSHVLVKVVGETLLAKPVNHG